MWARLRFNLLLALCAGSSHGWAAFSPVPPALTPAPIIIASTNPAMFTLKYVPWTPVSEAIKYRIYVTPIAQTVRATGPGNLVATNFDTTALKAAIPHLLYGQTYWIQGQTWTATTNSDLSEPLVWPPIITNVDITTIERSTNLIIWIPTGQAYIVTNDPGEAYFYRMVGKRTNNIDGFQWKE